MQYIDKTGSFSRNLITAAIASTLVLPAIAQAFEAKLSGQVSRMMVLPDDAAGDETQFVDIGWSGSRFRFTGSEKASNGLEYGFRFEIQARENSAGDVNGGTLADPGDNQDNRYQDIYISGDFGQVSFGKGDGAANGSTEVDLSGTALPSAAPLGDNWGNYEVAPGVTWGSVYRLTDALSRQNRIRYDSPNFSGFSVALGLNQGNSSEFALRYKGEFDGHQFGAAVFSATSADTATNVDGNDITGGSASLLLSNGINVTVALSETDLEAGGTDEGSFIKVGFKTGMHAFSVDVADGENAAGEEGDSTGLTYLVTPHAGVELFATIRTLDSDGVANSQSVDLTAIGTRILF